VAKKVLGQKKVIPTALTTLICLYTPESIDVSLGTLIERVVDLSAYGTFPLKEIIPRLSSRQLIKITTKISLVTQTLEATRARH
jgi:hypothetical protein